MAMSSQVRDCARLSPFSTSWARRSGLSSRVSIACKSPPGRSRSTNAEDVPNRRSGRACAAPLVVQALPGAPRAQKDQADGGRARYQSDALGDLAFVSGGLEERDRPRRQQDSPEVDDLTPAEDP